MRFPSLSGPFCMFHISCAHVTGGGPKPEKMMVSPHNDLCSLQLSVFALHGVSHVVYNKSLLNL